MAVCVDSCPSMELSSLPMIAVRTSCCGVTGAGGNVARERDGVDDDATACLFKDRSRIVRNIRMRTPRGSDISFRCSSVSSQTSHMFVNSAISKSLK